MKKVFLTLVFALFICLTMVACVSAQDAYLEEIGSDLKINESDPAQYFIVLDDAKFYTMSGTGVVGLVGSEFENALTALAEKYPDIRSGLGTKYLYKYVFPQGSTGVYFSRFKNDSNFINVAGALVFPSTVSALEDMNNSVREIRLIDFGENSQVRTIPFCFATMNMGSGTTKLCRLENFPKELDKIDKSAFARSPYLKGNLYLNATVIGDSAFNNSTNRLDGIVFGPKVTSIGNQSFTSYETGEIYVKFIEFQCDITKVTFALVANDYGSFYFEIGSGNQRKQYDKLECIVLSHPDNVKSIEEGKTRVQDFVAKLYFNNASATEAGNIAIASHNTESTIIYESFLKKGTKGDVCKDCGASLGVVEVEPIIKCLGYSFSEFSCAISQSFAINHKALNEYNEAHGENDKITSFGVFAISCEKANGSVFDDNNQIKAGACLIEYSSKATKYDIIEMKVQNITDAHKSSLIYCAGYITVGTNVIYIDNNKTSSVLENGVSFDSLIK